MSKPIPDEEYRKKPLSRFIQWVLGDADPYLGNVELRRSPETPPNETLRQRHREDREKVIDDVFDQKKNPIYPFFLSAYKVLCVIGCAALITILIVAVSYLPPVGHADNPANNEVSAKYIEDGLQDTGAVNIVTGMILDYRAFDTFGESNVLFIATCCVLILLRNDKQSPKQRTASMRKEQHYEPTADIILQKITAILFPIIVIFGVYVILNGHISPGGGFSGGAIIGAGLILYANAFGFEKLNRFFTEKTYKAVSFSALTFYCLAKSYSFFTGANHLESGIPLGNAGDILSSGLILPLNICVGMVVACTMYAFYTLFRKGGF